MAATKSAALQMPNRLVREGFLDSEAINRLGDPSECLYHRLMLAADDAGRMDGRAEILRARLFPLGSRRASDVEAQLRKCVEEALVIAYEWQGKPYLQITKWQRCSPCRVSKYPWKDGSHSIEYVKMETRDGLKEFVKTSLTHSEGIGIPSVGDLGVLPRMSVDGDGDGDGGVVGGAKAPPMGSGRVRRLDISKLDPTKASDVMTAKDLLKATGDEVQRMKDTHSGGDWTEKERQMWKHLSKRKKDLEAFLNGKGEIE